MTTTCHYCGARATGNFCSVCGNTLHSSAASHHHVAPSLGDFKPVHGHHSPQTAMGSPQVAMAGGGAIPAPAPEQETLETVVGPLLKKFFGWSELVHAALTFHTPLKGIRALLTGTNVALSRAFIAYLEFVTLIPFVLTQVIHPMGRSVGYPIIYQGAAVENTMVFYFVTAISGGIGLLLLYLLPNSLFQPRTKALVIAANLYMAMYAAVYTTLADFFKVGIWVVTRDLTWPTLLGNLVGLFILVLQFYVWRKVLNLSWWTTIVFLVLGTGILIAQNYMLVELGLLQFNQG